MRVIRAQPGHLMSALRADTSHVAVWRLRALLLQLHRSCAYAIVEDDQTIAVGGVVLPDLPGFPGEAWFLETPAAPRVMRSFVRRARRVLSFLLETQCDAISCFVPIGYRPGERLARLLGFSPTQTTMFGHRRWLRLGPHN